MFNGDGKDFCGGFHHFFGGLFLLALGCCGGFVDLDGFASLLCFFLGLLGCFGQGDSSLGVEAREVLELVEEDFQGAVNSVGRGDGSVGGDVQDESFVVGVFSESDVFHLEGYAFDGREDGVDGDGSDFQVNVLEFFHGEVSSSTVDGQCHFESCCGFHLADDEVAIDDLEVVGESFYVFGFEYGLPLDVYIDGCLVDGLFAQAFESHLFEVQHDFCTVLVDAGNGGEFMEDAFYFQVGDTIPF